MAQYTLTTTPLQEVILTAAVANQNTQIDQQNAAAAKQTPPGPQQPHIDKPTYLESNHAALLASTGQNLQAVVAQACIAAFAAASPSAQSQILQQLGLSAYAGLPAAALTPILATLGLQAFLALTVAQQNQLLTLAGLT